MVVFNSIGWKPGHFVWLAYGRTGAMRSNWVTQSRSPHTTLYRTLNPSGVASANHDHFASSSLPLLSGYCCIPCAKSLCHQPSCFFCFKDSCKDEFIQLLPGVGKSLRPYFHHLKPHLHQIASSISFIDVTPTLAWQINSAPSSLIRLIRLLHHHFLNLKSGIPIA